MSMYRTPEPGTHKGTPLGERIARTEQERAIQRAKAWHNEILTGVKTRDQVKQLLNELPERQKNLTRNRLNELVESYVVKAK